MVSQKSINTASKPAKIELIPDRSKLSADGEDISFITVRIVDENGNVCPTADNLVKFSISGAGSIAAVGNGDSATTAPFQSNQRKAFNGLCMLMVKSTEKDGNIIIKATSKGLEMKSLRLTTQ